jgi:hypothetical protein
VIVAWLLLLAVAAPQLARAQPAGEPGTRAELIAQAHAEKAAQLHPYEPNRAEELVKWLEEQFLLGAANWHPFFESAYSGGGFTLGAGYLAHLSPYNTLDVRGSYTFSGYKRIEAEFRAPRLFARRGVLSIVGGWREATQVGFYGFGTANTSQDDRANYSFTQPYLSATLAVRPARRLLFLSGGLEFSEWQQDPGSGAAPPVDEVYTPGTLPGLGSSPAYLHTQGTIALDWRDAAGYTRRGGYYGVTVHDFMDRDDVHGFRQVDYEAIQHVPILRDAWVLSLRGRIETTFLRDDQVIPFFMLPALGGGSSLRGFASWGASATATACCSRPNGVSSSTGSSTPRSSTTPGR